MASKRTVASLLLAAVVVSCKTLEFDPDLALKFILHSSAAHCGVQALEEWQCGRRCTEIGNFTTLGILQDKEYGGYGYVGYTDDMIVISYRGSVTAINWIEDFKFAKIRPFANQSVEVHDGFWQMHKKLMGQLLEHLQKAPRRPKLALTGHSLGASLAVLAALNLTKVRPDLPTPFIYNFGQPRVGNAAFVDNVLRSGVQMFRVVNQRDIVPHYPFETMNYRHMPTEVWWRNGSYHVCSRSNGEDPACSDGQLEFDPLDHPTYPPFPPGIDVSC